MTARYIVGIDPGLSGAIAFLDVIDGTLFVDDMPTYEREVRRPNRSRAAGESKTKKGVKSEIDRGRLASVFRIGGIRHAFLERVSTRMNESSSSALTIGWNFGLVEMAAQTAGCPVDIITPQSWKSALRVSGDKDESLARATQLLPRCASLWPLKKHNGRAEAVLIALYGCRQLGLDLPLIMPGKVAA